MRLPCIAGGLLAAVCFAGLDISAAFPAAQAQVEEDSLVARVRARLHEERHHLSPGALASVHISAYGGFVLLQGTVPTMLDKTLIDTLTRSVDGVRAVGNELVVPGEVPPYQPVG